jgi:hypothetical protein
MTSKFNRHLVRGPLDSPAGGSGGLDGFPPASASKAPAPIRLGPAWLADARLVRHSALTFLLALLVAVFAVGGTNWWLQEETATAAQARKTRDLALQAAHDVEVGKVDIAQYQARFLELREMGLIGDERRLEWVEAIRQSQAERKLFPITYDIEPQQPVVLDGQLDLGDYQLRASKMVLHMELLHEMDMLNFLDDLKKHHFFAVEHCAVKRNAMSADAAQMAGLIADCTLNWVTLGPPGTLAPAPAGAAP